MRGLPPGKLAGLPPRPALVCGVDMRGLPPGKPAGAPTGQTCVGSRRANLRGLPPGKPAGAAHHPSPKSTLMFSARSARSKLVHPMVSRISTVLIAVSCFLLGSAAGQTDLDALIEAGHFKQVERALDASKSRDPETLYLLSKVKQSFGKTNEAVSLAEQAVKADPNKAKYHLQLADVLSD